MDNAGIARTLREISALLALDDGSRFKARAYERGARAVEALAEDVSSLDTRRLRSIPGIGATLARTILELKETGGSEVLTRLRDGAPAGAAELSVVLTRRQMTILRDALGIASLSALKTACEAGQVRAVPGFGERTERRLLGAIEALAAPRTHIRLSEATQLGEMLLAHLRRHPAVVRAELAGDLRRRAELIERLDLVVATRDAAAVVDHAARAPMTGAVRERLGQEVRLGLVTGPDARLLLVPPKAFAITLLRTTGSDAHLAKLAAAGFSRRVRVEADGLYRGSRRLPVPEEADAYRQLGLPAIPPELREDAGEVEAALAGTLPEELVRSEDIRGAVHCHTQYSDGRHTIEAMARAAEARGMRYLTITDHSPTAAYAGGLDIERLRRQWDEIASVQERVAIRLLRGTEADILRDGALDYPDAILEQLDVVIASLHQRHRMSRAEMTRRLVRALRHPRFKIWGHPLGRYVTKRPPLDCDVPAVLDAVAESRAAIEVNGNPERLDLPPNWIREARARGIRFVISTDAHSTGELDNLRWGVDMARRGWLTRGEVLNTLDADPFRRTVRP